MKIHKALLFCLLPVLMVACQQADDAEVAATVTGQRAESFGLGLVLADISDAWSIEDAEALKLARTGELQGEVWVEIEPNQFNLVEAVNDWKGRYEAMPEGSFMGQLELGTQLGTAYTVRGRYSHEGAPVEERRILALHPGGIGLAELVYRYPEESDSQARGQEMFELFGGLEHLSTVEPAGEEP